MISLFSDIDHKFAEFDRQHPEVYQHFCRLAKKAMSYGRERIGAKQIIEVIRWEVFLDHEDREFKINNNFTSRYARKFMKEHNSPDLFETRALQ